MKINFILASNSKFNDWKFLWIQYEGQLDDYVRILCFLLQYAIALGEYVEKEKIQNLKVWTSELKRTKATARHVKAPLENWKALNEIDAVRQQNYI